MVIFVIELIEYFTVKLAELSTTAIAVFLDPTIYEGHVMPLDRRVIGPHV